MLQLLAFLMSMALLALPRPSLAGENGEPARSRLYLNSFQSGKLVAADPTTGRIELGIAVEDGAGPIGFAVSGDGKRLFIIDGNNRSRLRIIDAATGKTIAEHSFENRLLTPGGAPGVHLTADDRWLLISTYDPTADARGVRVFDVQNDRFLPVGLSGRGCDNGRYVSARDGLLLELCSNVLRELRLSPKPPGEGAEKMKIDTGIETPADLALSPDGKDLFVLGEPEEDEPWELSHWQRGGTFSVTHDLDKLPDVADGISDSRGRPVPTIRLSPDGARLAIAAGAQLWLLDRATMQVLQHHKLGLFVCSTAFTADGSELLAVQALPGGGGELVRIAASTGNTDRVPLGKLATRLVGGPAVFRAAPAP